MKAKAVLAYVFTWLGGLIVYFSANEEEKNLKFHAAQAIVLGIINVAASIICGFIPFGMTIAGIINLIVFVFMVIGIIKVVKEDTELELPIIGELTHSIFKI